ncbi:MAG: hypothetical protein RL095_3422 [Verrucomicrobiota bacterium]|jgi:ferric-dicitrate binding protein FerR (iron transport regulator)
MDDADVELIALCLEGQPDEASRARFKERLRDPTFRRLILDFEADSARLPRLLLEMQQERRAAARRPRALLFWRRLAWGASAALVLIACCLYFWPASAELPRVVHAAAGWPAEGKALAAGLEYLVPEEAQVTLAYPDGSTIHLAAGTRLSFDNRSGKTLILHQGTLSAEVSPQAAGKPMRLRCPQAEAEVVGTRFTLLAAERLSTLKVEKGLVNFGDGRSRVQVQAGRQAQADGLQPIIVQNLAPDNAQSLARWKAFSQKLRFDPAMVAYYDFQEGKGDQLHCVSPGGKDGKISLPLWMAGRWQGKHSLLLDQGRKVDVADFERLRLKGPCSVFVWFCVQDWSKPYHALISKGQWSWRIQRGIDSPGLEFAFSGFEPNVVYGKIPVNDGRWHLACGVYDGNSLAIFIDGRLDQKLPCKGRGAQSSDALEIGANTHQPHPNANCWIDEIGILERAFSAEEIKALWEAGKP